MSLPKTPPPPPSWSADAPLSPEDRAVVIEQLEKDGWMVPGCVSCQEFYDAPDPRTHFAPRHKAKSWCESGRKPHCTCDRCF